MPRARVRPQRARSLAALIAAVALAASGCGGSAARPVPQRAVRGGDVSVLYAGALVSLMEHRIAPAFDRASGYRFQGFPGGSVALAKEITGKVRKADVFISATPQVDRSLMGKSHGDWIQWYVPFAQAPLVVAFSPRSRFAAQWKTKPWYQVMAERGFRLGRTDPKLDPKGALTLQFLHAASHYYHRPGLSHALLGPAENPAQVFPEETLVGRLQAGQLDAGFFYANEAVQAHLPYITPPGAIDPKAVFTVTIVRGAPNPGAAAAFVRFLLGPQGRALLQPSGVTLIPPQAIPTTARLPGQLRSVLR